MKKVLPYILIVFILAGTFSPSAYVRAAVFDQTTQSCVPAEGYVVVDTIGGKICATPEEAERINAGLDSTKENLLIKGAKAVAGEVIAPILSRLFWFVMKLASIIMAISGIILDKTIFYTVVNMSDGVSKVAGINTVWKIIRDLMNISFIFILLYEAIKIILSQSSYQTMFKRVGFIILSALLINFSLFFTKVLIDASNVVTIGFYQSITGKDADPSNTLSTKYAQTLGLQGFFSTNSISLGAGASEDNYSYLVANIMASVLFVIVAFVFFAMTILFVVRYIVLIFLLALSPIAYMGWALPEVKKYSNQWWDSFKGQLLFGPVFMLFTWVVLTLIAGSIAGNVYTLDYSKWPDLATAPGNAVDLLFNFALVIGLTILSLVTAKQTATQGSKLIGDFSGRASAFAGGALLGGTAALSRNTLGRAGNRMADSEYLKDKAAKGGVSGFMARQALIAGDKSAKSTFDVRGTDSFKSISKATKFDFGKASDPKKTTYKAEMDERLKNLAKREEILKSSDLAADQAKKKLVSSEFIEEERKRKIEATKDYVRIKGELDNDVSKLNKDRADLNASETKLKELNLQLSKLQIGTPTWNKMKADVGALKEETDRKKNAFKQFESSIKDKQKWIKENESEIGSENWMSPERKRLIATAGGTTEEKTKGGIKTIKDPTGKVLSKIDKEGNIIEGGPEVKVDSAYVQRIEERAKGIESRTIGRWVANTLGVGTNIAGVTPLSMSKRDRQELARKLRTQAKGKSKQAKFADLAKEIADDAKEEEEAPATPPPASGGGEGGGTPPANPTS